MSSDDADRMFKEYFGSRLRNPEDVFREAFSSKHGHGSPFKFTTDQSNFFGARAPGFGQAGFGQAQSVSTTTFVNPQGQTVRRTVIETRGPNGSVQRQVNEEVPARVVRVLDEDGGVGEVPELL